MAKLGYKAMLEAANQEVETIPPAEAVQRLGDPDIQFVDVRDVPELERDGMIPGAVHAPRGFLEFLIDPESPMHKAELASGKKLVFYCASGGRSALAAQTAKRMGLDKVANLQGGIGGWKQAGGKTAPRPKTA